MHRTVKAVFALFFISSLLNSCGPVTPWPTETITPTRTKPAKEGVREHATATAFIPSQTTPTSEVPAESGSSKLSTHLWENTPPSQLVDQYQLVPWTSEFTETMTDLLNRVSEDAYRYVGRQSDDYRAAFASEAWLRTGSKMENGSWLCDVNYYDPEAEQFPGQRPGQDLYSYFVEDLINNRNIAAENLLDATSELIATPDCLGGYSLSSSGNLWFTPGTVQNLFGDGQNSFVFPVGSILYSGDRVAFYATHVVGERVQVERVKDWEQYFPVASGYDFKIVDVGDQNHNGRNEFAIQVEYGASGDPPKESEWLNFYEWDPQTSSFQASDQVTVFSQDCSHGACFGDWKLSSGGSDTFGWTAHEYFNTGLAECEYVVREKEYKLDFESIALLSDRYLLPEANTQACQAAWAFEVVTQPDGWKNDRAIHVLENTLTDWPAELNDVFGKEGRNYVQLMLGLWHDLRGESGQALRLIDPLKDQQINSKYTFIAQLAQTYLDARQQSGMAAACFHLNDLQRQLLSDTNGEESWTMLGFWDPRWTYWAEDICDDNAAISSQFSISTFPVRLDQESLERWLADQGMKEINIQKVELDEQEIWLASFLTDTNQQYDINYYQLWAFSDHPSGRDAVFMNETTIDKNKSGGAGLGENSVLVKTFDPKGSSPMSLVEFDDCLSFLGFSSGKLEIFNQKCGIDLDFSVEGDQVTVMDWEFSPGIREFFTYRWNNHTKSIQETSSKNFDFDSVENKVESRIYRENDYQGAIVDLAQALANSPPDQVTWPYCYEYMASRASDIATNPEVTLCSQPMEWHRPYLLYLLALSYEKSGRLEDARNTYYALWREYPKNVFGVAASMRLEPVHP